MHSAVVVCVLCLSSCAPAERASAYVAAFSDTLDTTHHPFEQLRLRVAEPIEWCLVKPDLRSQLHSFSAWSIGSGRVDELRRIGQEAEASLFLFLDRGRTNGSLVARFGNQARGLSWRTLPWTLVVRLSTLIWR